MWRVEVVCPLRHNQRPMMLYQPTPSHLSHTVNLIVNVDHPVYSVIGQSTHLMMVRIGLTFARSFALRSYIYICVQMNKHGMLIMCLKAVTSIGNKTKHTYTHTHTVQKNKPNFTVVIIGISIGYWNFSPKYRNIGHRKFQGNRLPGIYCYANFSL